MRNSVFRQHQISAKLQRLDLDGLLVTAPWDVEWITGFSGSNGIVLFLKARQPVFFTDFRYKEIVNSTIKNCQIIITSEGYLSEIKRKNLVKDGMRIGLQSDNISLQSYKKTESTLENIRLIPLNDFFSEFTSVKNDQEKFFIKRATAITTEVFKKTLEIIAVNKKITERELAAEISYWNKRLGSDGDSFSPIVASGKRSAMPHASPTDHVIQKNTFLIIDMGCKYKGYCSDQTRTISIGRPNNEMKKIYQTVLDAHLIGIEKAVAGAKAKDVDAAARNHIKDHGYGDCFGHGLGHGIGLQIHEAPKLSQKSKDIIQEGSIVTIEPGIYVSNQFGVRIEDAVVVTTDGGKSLSEAPKELIIC